MKYSADDILSQTFESRFRGYDPDQVHEFLYGLSREWEALSTQLKTLSEQAASQEVEIKEYRSRERALQDALEMARQVSEDLKTQARRDADLLLAETELKAEKMLSAAQRDVSSTQETLNRLKQQRVQFESEMRRAIDAHAKILELYLEGEADHHAIDEVGETDSPVPRVVEH